MAESLRVKSMTWFAGSLLMLALSGCGGGRDGNSCTAVTTEDGIHRVECTDGSSFLVEDGVSGADGTDGTNGTNGTDGTNGTNGTNGTDGTDGTNGTDGASCSVVTLADGTLGVQCGTEPPVSLGPSPRRRHVILIIGDGMQLAHEISGSRYLFGSDRALSFHAFPTSAFVTTWDVTTYNRHATALAAPAYSPYFFTAEIGYDPVRGGYAPYPLLPTPDAGYFLTPLGGAQPATDSASAGAALATGVKTDSGNIAWLPGDPAGGSLTTIAERLRAERGFAIGVASTVPFSHATPASFVSHNVSRSNYHAIATEIAESVRPEVVIGGGHPAFNTSANPQQYVSETTVAKLRTSAEYLFIERTAGVQGGAALLAAAAQVTAEGRKLFGLFGGLGGNFEYAAPTNAPGAPAVTVGSVENPSLADAAEAALSVLGSYPDGFFLMLEQGDIDWANHANNYRNMVGGIWSLHGAVQRVLEFVERPGDAIDWANTLVLVTSDHGNGYLRFGPTPMGAGVLPQQTCESCAGNTDAYPGGEVTYGSGNHTNELVSLYAKGAGADLVASYATAYDSRAIIDNTAIYELMLTAAMR